MRPLRQKVLASHVLSLSWLDTTSRTRIAETVSIVSSASGNTTVQAPRLIA